MRQPKQGKNAYFNSKRHSDNVNVYHQVEASMKAGSRHLDLSLQKDSNCTLSNSNRK
jgi:hypothetical protein